MRLTDFEDFLLKICILDEWQDGTLKRCNQGREVEVSALSVVRSRLETVLEDAVEHSADTERWLDYVGDVLLLLVCFSLSIELNHLLVESELLALNCQP